MLKVCTLGPQQFSAVISKLNNDDQCQELLIIIRHDQSMDDIIIE